eukprot:jgi/Hompol1/652/HPOL_001485-RA
MSLPKRVVAAGPTSVPQFSSVSTAANMGVAEPTYIPVLRQVHMMQMTRLFDQLVELSTYANEMFVDLANQTLHLSERITDINHMLEFAKSDMSIVEADIQNAAIRESLQRERYAWKTETVTASNMFTKSTQPACIAAAYQKCRPAPQLDVLDQYRNDGLPCMRFYSYPDFFVEEWKTLMVKDHDGKRAKKKAKGDVEVRRMTINTHIYIRLSAQKYSAAVLT